MDRIGTICAALPCGRVLADIGCDHGYCARPALKRGYEKIYLTDVSAGSLEKAKKLLREEIRAGKCIPVLCDGMRGLPEPVDTVLIAGLGGEEIVRILREGDLPEKFVFQPMKNAEKLRGYLVGRGCSILRDDTFRDGGYFYDLIVGEREGGSKYSALELAFGRDNLRERGNAFLEKLELECKKIRGYLKEREMNAWNREKLIGRMEKIEEILNGAE